MKSVYIVTLLSLPMISGHFAVAQTSAAGGHKKIRKHKHAKEQLKPNAEEKKKAAVQRTLKEKGFHLPDTSHKR
jgi:hypothetical protein